MNKPTPAKKKKKGKKNKSRNVNRKNADAAETTRQPDFIKNVELYNIAMNRKKE